ncbi:MAG: hypothetical protein PHE43_01205 [Candidatus Nanoarchaeia archaeon]|nr:hypothetical protein [Candidatus Nanoarchaeia archaeon]
MSPQQFFMPEFQVEIIYSFILILSSLMIYAKTKEMYNLTADKGIKYFRESFLFFAIAFFSRFVIMFLFTLFGISKIFDFSSRIISLASSILFIYTSTIAIFYLFYSMTWKKWDENSKKVIYIHLITAIIVLLVILTRNGFVLFASQLILSLITLGIVFNRYLNSKNKKAMRGNLIIYTLLFIFWTFNTIQLFVPAFLGTFKILVYLISIGAFLAIFYEVIKRTG